MDKILTTQLVSSLLTIVMVLESFNVDLQTLCKVLQGQIAGTHKPLMGICVSHSERKMEIFYCLSCYAVHFAMAKKLMVQSNSLQQMINKTCIFEFAENFVEPMCRIPLHRPPKTFFAVIAIFK